MAESGILTEDVWHFDGIVPFRLCSCVMFLGLRPLGKETRWG